MWRWRCLCLTFIEKIKASAGSNKLTDSHFTFLIFFKRQTVDKVKSRQEFQSCSFWPPINIGHRGVAQKFCHTQTERYWPKPWTLEWSFWASRLGPSQRHHSRESLLYTSPAAPGSGRVLSPLAWCLLTLSTWIAKRCPRGWELLQSSQNPRLHRCRG